MCANMLACPDSGMEFVAGKQAIQDLLFGLRQRLALSLEQRNHDKEEYRHDSR
jgi:hypothetical protein